MTMTVTVTLIVASMMLHHHSIYVMTMTMTATVTKKNNAVITIWPIPLITPSHGPECGSKNNLHWKQKSLFVKFTNFNFWPCWTWCKELKTLVLCTLLRQFTIKTDTLTDISQCIQPSSYQTYVVTTSWLMIMAEWQTLLAFRPSPILMNRGLTVIPSRSPSGSADRL